MGGAHDGEKSTSSSVNGVDSWWNFLMRIHISFKMKLFIWHACKNWVPTRVNLDQRGVLVDTVCPLCRCGKETMLHALWGCRLLKEV